MARPATTRLKCNPPLGRLPVLQYLRPSELSIEPAYQRSINALGGQTLIRQIAQHWNWDLCQPLVVAVRSSGALVVIDGQHRLEAARLRGDIDQLPCTILRCDSVAEEAANFVHLNQQRRPLSKLELFKAAVAGDDPEACAIAAALATAGLSIAPHTNYTAWKPGMVANIGGIARSWRRRGPQATSWAMVVLAGAYPGEILRYAGTIFPGIAAICAEDGDGCEFELMREMVAARPQVEWRNLIMRARADDFCLNYERAAEQVLSEHWDEFLGARLSGEVA